MNGSFFYRYNYIAMEALPTELLLKVLVNLDSSTVENMRKTSGRIKDVIDANEDYIYSKFIKRDFSCLESKKDIYTVLSGTTDRKAYIDVCLKNKNYNDLGGISKEQFAKHVRLLILHEPGRTTMSKSQAKNLYNFMTDTHCIKHFTNSLKITVIEKIKEYSKKYKRSDDQQLAKKWLSRLE